MHFCKQCARKLRAGVSPLQLARSLRTGKARASLKDGVLQAYQSQKKALLERLRKSNEKYEEVVGLADVQDAQKRVKEAETIFLEARANERAILREMAETRERLKQVRERLSHVDYSNPMYLKLASDQHELVNDEERQKRSLEEAEDHERDSFQNLSNIMRESYEQERARVERTKNWSIIGTVVGTIIGMMGSIYMNRVRTKDLMKAVKDGAYKGDLSSKLESLASATEEKQTAVVTALNSVSGNLAEMSDALQVKNLEVLAGLVEDPLTGRTSAADAYSSHQRSVSTEALAEEMRHYNEALVALSNAVTALSDSAPPRKSDGTRRLERLLENQAKMIASLRAKMDGVISAAKGANLGSVSDKLSEMDKKLSRLSAAENTGESGAVVFEMQPGEEGPGWPIGVRGVVLWGAIIGALYLFVKF